MFVVATRWRYGLGFKDGDWSYPASSGQPGVQYICNQLKCGRMDRTFYIITGLFHDLVTPSDRLIMFQQLFLVLVLLGGVIHAQYTSPSYANFTGPDGPVIDLGYTKLQGTRMTSANFPVNAWLGVRFAQSPTAQLRFSPPRPIEASDFTNETFDASTFGPYCYQGYPPAQAAAEVLPIYDFGNRQPSEDCLLLDVYAPANPVSPFLPVLLLIHGGGYDQGGTTLVPPAGIMSAAPGQFIFVALQYRLSGFGFLGGAEVAGSGALNAGLLDQRLGMEWVQRHISAFGGDPSRVTIQGGSAGGGSVSYQLIWEGGETNPPYRAAMAEYPWWQTYLNASQLEVQYRGVLSAANCSDIACLRALPASDYNNAQERILSLTSEFPYGLFYYGPTIDGNYIRDLPSREMQAGHFAKVALLTTRDGNEGHEFTPQNITTEAGFEARMRSFLNGGDNFFCHLTDYYPPTATGLYAYNSTQQRAEFVLGDWIIQCPTYYLASSYADAFSRLDQATEPVYKFIYALPAYDTAYHGAYTALTFTTFPVGSNDTSYTAELIRMFQSYFVSFIIDLDPNSGAGIFSSPQVIWPSYGSTSQILLFNSTVPSQIYDIDATGHCDFFLAHPYNVQN